MADDVFVCDANAAVQLHRLLADVTHRVAQLVFGAGHRSAALGRGGVEFQRGVITHGAAQLQLHLHVGGAVAQRLERADGDAKSLARVEVFGGDGEGFLHRAYGFCAQAGDADVYCMFQRGQAVGADECGGRVSECDFSRASAVLRAVTARCHTGCRRVDQKHRHLSGSHRGHQKRLGFITHRHQALGTTHGPFSAIEFGRSGAHVKPVTRRTLLISQHHDGYAAGHFGQPSRFHVGRGITREHTTGDQRLGQWFADDAAPQLFHHHHAFHRPHAQATIGFGHIQAAQAELGQFAISLGRVAASVGNFSATLEGIGLLHPLGDCVAELLLFV